MSTLNLRDARAESKVSQIVSPTFQWTRHRSSFMHPSTCSNPSSPVSNIWLRLAHVEFYTGPCDLDATPQAKESKMCFCIPASVLIIHLSTLGLLSNMSMNLQPMDHLLHINDSVSCMEMESILLRWPCNPLHSSNVLYAAKQQDHDNQPFTEDKLNNTKARGSVQKAQKHVNKNTKQQASKLRLYWQYNQ